MGAWREGEKGREGGGESERAELGKKKRMWKIINYY